MSLCTTFTYDNADRRTSTTYPTGSTAVVENEHYDNAGNLDHIWATTGSTTLTDITYTYTDPSSSTTDRALRQSMTLNASTYSPTAVATAYTYDGHDRLWKADLPGTASDQTYLYDDAGDRLSRQIGSTTITDTYNNALELKIETGQASTPAYDGNGNETVDPTARTESYTSFNQTRLVDLSPFTYRGADSTESANIEGSSAADTILGLDRTSFTHITTTTAYYLRDPHSDLLGDNVNGTHRYYLHDALGSIIGIVSSTGSLIGTTTYDPWGRVTGTTGSATTPWGYASGYVASSGLVKFGTRFYDPELGRFTQRDPAQQGNLYAYANDNPINMTDPTGRCTLGIFGDGCTAGSALEAIGTAIGAASLIITFPESELIAGTAISADSLVLSSIGLTSSIFGYACDDIDGFCED